MSIIVSWICFFVGIGFIIYGLLYKKRTPLQTFRDFLDIKMKQVENYRKKGFNLTKWHSQCEDGISIAIGSQNPTKFKDIKMQIAFCLTEKNEEEQRVQFNILIQRTSAVFTIFKKDILSLRNCCKSL